MIFDWALKKALPTHVFSKLLQLKAKQFGMERKYRHLTAEESFNKIYREGLWGRDLQGNSTSGPGSHDQSVVEPYIKEVKRFLSALDRPVIVDLGCGDFNVGKNLVADSRQYVGCDISQEVIRRNIANYRDDKLEFKHVNIAADELPMGDVALVRQVFQHMSNKDIGRFVDKVNDSTPYKYLIVTEHIPAFTFKANLDKPAGPGIRVVMGSGVDIAQTPFNLKYKESRILVDVRKEHAGVNAIIRSTVFVL
ncbi:MAG TPA: class I SAM-dependent methyltransferase [Thermohalobaculum sp.]|nr:class I SAM-dependent methyltransferase [Thermohalobaculum sp.]